MQKRTLHNLILENEDFIFAGDLTVKGEVNIKNGSLIVSGNLILNDYTQIKGGDISCDSIDAADITIIDGDFFVHKNTYCAEIESDGDIEIGGDNNSSSIRCFNFLVSGNNNSTFINAIHDVYILGINDSFAIKARDVLIDGDCSFDGYGLTSKTFTCSGNIVNCSYMSVG